MAALGQEKGGRFAGAGRNEAPAADRKPVGLGRRAEIVGAQGGIDEIRPSARL